MKIIDKTPFQDEKGEISLLGRIQGTLKFGFDWYGEMEAQKNLVGQLNRALEKGFVLIRNLNLPGSPIYIPLILIGTGGMYLLYATNVKGHFEAKGDQWNVIDGSGNSQPARTNLLDKTAKLTRNFQKFLEINKIKIPVTVEPALVAVNPGAHIDVSRPAIRVVKSDVIKSYIASLTQAVPVMRADAIYELADRIAEPRLREPEPQPQPEEVEEPAAFGAFGGFDDSPAAAESFNPGGLRADFVEPQPQEPQRPVEPRFEKPKQPVRRRAPVKKIFGMTKPQFYVLAGIFACWLLVMLGVGALLFLQPR